jgi:hypothetical protein
MAAMNKLNGRAVDTARIDAGEKMLGDGGNLYLRVRPESRSWVFNYTAPNGKRRKMILGDYPTHSLADARAWAAEQRRLLGEGVDPAAARDAAVAAAKAPVATSKTVGDLLETYRDSLTGKPSHRQVANVLKNHVPDSLRKLPLATVTKADLAAPIRKLKDTGKLRTGGLLHSYIMRAFTLAHDAHENPDAPAAFVQFTMVSNPVADMKPIKGAAGETHEQVMTIAQLREYAAALQGKPQSTARDILLLSLFTGGQRLAQVARATMEGDAVMVIMDSKGKRVTARRHALPLIGPVSGITAPGVSDNLAVDNLVDAATSIVEKISGGAYTQRVIRRTVENLLFDAGFSPSDTGLLLSHGLSGVQYQHYLRGDKLELKTRMLQCLHGMLLANVVPLRGAA